MLDKELWKRLPAALPSLADVLNARSNSSDEAGGSSGGAGGGGGGSLPQFERFVVQGNPWRKQQSPRRGRRGAGAGRQQQQQQQQQQLGFGGSAGTDDSSAARQLEVDEYGVPRSASNTPSASAAGGGGGGGGGRGSSAQSEAGATEDGGTEDGELLQQEEEPDDVFGEHCAVGRSWEAAWERGKSCLQPGHGHLSAAAPNVAGAPALRGTSTALPAGDFIDEDTQQVRSGGGDAGGTGGDVAPAVTNSSWRMYKWMRDYSQLMRCATAAAAAAAAAVMGGCCVVCSASGSSAAAGAARCLRSG
jgi:hypothetical protein